MTATHCLIPDPSTLHPIAQSAFWERSRGGLTEFGNPDLAFLYFATIVQSNNFAWVECLIRLANA